MITKIDIHIQKVLTNFQKVSLIFQKSVTRFSKSVTRFSKSVNDVISGLHLKSMHMQLSPLHRRERVMLFRHQDSSNRTRYKGLRAI